MKKISLISLLTLFSVIVFAQNTVLVKVYNRSERSALPGAFVEFVKTTDQQQNQITNNLGCSRFKMDLGTYKLTIKADGFKQFTDYMTIENLGDAIFVFLDPDPFGFKPREVVDIQVKKATENVNVYVKDNTTASIPKDVTTDLANLRPVENVAEDNSMSRFVPEPDATPKKPAVANLNPVNLVIVADKSTSMNDNGKMALLKEMLLDICTQLIPGDKLSIIVCDVKSRVLFTGKGSDDFEEMITEIIKLRGNGFTKVTDAVKQAYELCIRESQYNTRNRVVFLTDGAIDTGDLNRMFEETKNYGIQLKVGAVKPLPLAERSLKDVMDKYNGSYQTVVDSKSVRKFIESSTK